MADDQTTPKAGGTLDLSTGKPAPPPTPPPAPPPMPADADPAVRAGRTLDLSKRPSVPSTRRPAGFGGALTVRETVDLSTRTPAPTEPAPSATAPRPTDSGAARSTHGGGSARGGDSRGGDSRGGGSRERGKAPASAASSLADLLDPEVLAKLRGDG